MAQRSFRFFVRSRKISWVTKNLFSRVSPCFGRHVKPLVPAAFAVVSTHLSALGPRACILLGMQYDDKFGVMVSRPSRQIAKYPRFRSRPTYAYSLEKRCISKKFVSQKNLRWLRLRIPFSMLNYFKI
jgi:hypothetical protein